MPINKKLLDAIKLGNEEGIRFYIKNEDDTCGDCGDYHYYGEDYDAHCTDINIQNDVYNNWSLLHYAIFHNKPNIVQLLLDLGANLEIKAKRGVTPLHLAVFYNRVEIVKILLDEEANIDVVNNFGDTPLDLAHKKYSNNKSYKNITELLEEAVRDRTTVSSIIENIITSNTKKRLLT